MRTRLATVGDFPEIARLGANFWAQTAHAFIPYDEDSLLWYCGQMLGQRLLVVVESAGGVVGFAGAMIAPLLGNLRWRIAGELLWWIELEHRSTETSIALLKALEEHALVAGVHILSLMKLDLLEPEQAAMLYARAGYGSNERAFTKVLQTCPRQYH